MQEIPKKMTLKGAKKILQRGMQIETNANGSGQIIQPFKAKVSCIHKDIFYVIKEHRELYGSPCHEEECPYKKTENSWVISFSNTHQNAYITILSDKRQYKTKGKITFEYGKSIK